MQQPGKPLTMYADDEFLALIDSYAKKERISRSLAIRQIVIDFFSKGGING